MSGEEIIQETPTEEIQVEPKTDKGKRLLSILAIIVVSLIGVGLFYFFQIRTVTGDISPTETMAKMNSNRSIVLLDVRSVQEFEREHIPGAILIPHDEILDRAYDEILSYGTTIVVYCQSGGRSAEAVRNLIDLGYRRVFDLGGIANWPYETTN
ncbi:MAG: rhodanese-like domain-containing protein [Pseudomonadales bacterium]|jgi:rhodanese-related sulfurtransferase|nr:rhodanese-like domain-containing protein [Pseudomonadales bacterium]